MTQAAGPSPQQSDQSRHCEITITDFNSITECLLEGQPPKDTHGHYSDTWLVSSTLDEEVETVGAAKNADLQVVSARPAGFEPATSCSGGKHSIH